MIFPLLFCCFPAVIALFFPLRFDKRGSYNKDLSGMGELGRKPQQRQGVRKARLLPRRPDQRVVSQFEFVFSDKARVLRPRQ
jgi:hypothetical protein